MSEQHVGRLFQGPQKSKLYVNNKPYSFKSCRSRAVQRFQVEPLQSRDKNKDLVLKFEIMEV